MVAIIDSGDISDVLWRLFLRGERDMYTVAWRRSEWEGAKSHLALLLNDEDTVAWLGRARGRKNVSDRDRRVEILEIEDFPGPKLDALRVWVPNRHVKSVQLGVLPDATGRAVVRALVERYPHWAETIGRLEQPERFVLPDGQRGRLFNEQRDGIGLVLEIGGLDRDVLREWSPDSAASPSFLAGVRPPSVSEQQLLNHDVGRFPDLVEELNAEVDWRVFENDRRRMFVMNANMEPVEETLGVDVVYYNETFKSFVLVQYKRMVSDGSHKLWYRPDGHLASELKKMQVVDEEYGSKDGDFRLFGKATWLKLCNPDARPDDPRELIKGMYLAREHFVELMNTCRGPRGGVRMGYENVPRHINNTTFTQLVKDGWIGTRGSGTVELRKIIRTVLESRRALVLGALLDDQAAQPSLELDQRA
jgi:hypothetical protein